MRCKPWFLGMMLLLVGGGLACGASLTYQEAKQRLKPLRLPDWWIGDVEQLQQRLEKLKEGSASVIARSAGGRPVWLVSFGQREPVERLANFNSAVGAREPAAYADKAARRKPVILLIGPVHGHEVEGLTGLVNLIAIMETGRDLRDRDQLQLQRLARQCRLLIIPCGNPDGVARFEPRAAHGMTHDEFQFWGQGTWADGTIAYWPRSKRVHPFVGPLVGFMGCYFDQRGVNPMHDEFFDPMGKEAPAILRLAREEAPDLAVSLHSHEAAPALLRPAWVPVEVQQEVADLAARVAKLSAQRDLPHGPAPSVQTQPPRETDYASFNLVSAVYHTSGATAFVFECPHGIAGPKACQVTLEQILDIQLTLYQAMFEHALERKAARGSTAGLAAEKPAEATAQSPSQQSPSQQSPSQQPLSQQPLSQQPPSPKPASQQSPPARQPEPPQQITGRQVEEEPDSPLANLPPHIKRLTHFGERADWSHDGKRILFLAKTFGDVYELELATGIIRPMTHHYFHAGYVRALYLSNGDILLSGAPKFDPADAWASRWKTPELWVLSRRLDGPPVPLGVRCAEGPAVSRKHLRIAWTISHQLYPEELPAGASQIWMADIVYEQGKPKLANKRKVLDSRDLPFRCGLETQNFRPPEENELTFSAYGYQGTEVMGVDLKTGKLTNYSNAPGQYDEPEGIFPDGKFTCVECDRHNPKGSQHIDIYKLALDGSGKLERLTYFNDGGKWKASNPVISDDGRFMAFQAARVGDVAGVGRGILLYDFQKAKAAQPQRP